MTTLRCLIVDDNQFNRQLLETIMGKFGYETHTARDAMEPTPSYHNINLTLALLI